eukprot:CAMPEP_0197061766 /NCGR_PEP_ID=MMETSP1384-20130603/139267_1 /TAXON_ID=29189 /ORGANISM="Ammonia sp." /LENGTH=107 /DNA_ID=CAMNT_0042497497 /DNA_START=227 /DNA_END=548 /DNA_ORIENTATION=+
MTAESPSIAQAVAILLDHQLDWFRPFTADHIEFRNDETADSWFFCHNGDLSVWQVEQALGRFLLARSSFVLTGNRKCDIFGWFTAWNLEDDFQRHRQIYALYVLWPF